MGLVGSLVERPIKRRGGAFSAKSASAAAPSVYLWRLRPRRHLTRRRNPPRQLPTPEAGRATPAAGAAAPAAADKRRELRWRRQLRPRRRLTRRRDRPRQLPTPEAGVATVSFGHATLLCLLPSFLPCRPSPLSQDSRHKAQSLYLNPHLSYHRVSTGAGAASTPGGAGAKCPQVPAPPLPPAAPAPPPPPAAAHAGGGRGCPGRGNPAAPAAGRADPALAASAVAAAPWMSAVSYDHASLLCLCIFPAGPPHCL